MFLTIYDEYGFPSGSGGANMGDGIPRFKNRYPEASLSRLDKHEEEIYGPGPYAKPLPEGKLMSIVAMKTGTKERVDLTDQASGGSISWSIPSGSWKIMTFVCVLDGDPNVDYLEPEQRRQVHQHGLSALLRPIRQATSARPLPARFTMNPPCTAAQGRLWTDRFNEKIPGRPRFQPDTLLPCPLV